MVSIARPKMKIAISKTTKVKISHAAFGISIFDRGLLVKERFPGRGHLITCDRTGTTNSATASSASTQAHVIEAPVTEAANRRADTASLRKAAAEGGLAGIRECAEQLGEDAGAAEAEVLAFAAYLGIDPVADADLLWIAFDAAAAPLPHHWRELQAPDGAPYYQCMRSGRTQVDGERSRS